MGAWVVRSVGRLRRCADAETLVTAMALAWAATATVAAQPAEGGPIPVVATTTVLADLVAQTGGDLVTVRSLVPKGGEVHTFDPSPSDAIALAEADLVVMNGLGLDAWLRDLAESSGAADVPIIELAPGLDGVTYLAPGAHDDEHDDEGGTDDDANPHLWLDAEYAARYVERIAQALEELDPERASLIDERAGAYIARLVALDAEIAAGLAEIPAERRRVISLHEAFPYFAAAYGLEVVDVVIEDPGQEPSAASLAWLIKAVREQGVAGIFAETQFPDDLVDTIASETGIAVVRGLHSDTLADAPADTYEGMMRANMARVTDALR